MYSAGGGGGRIALYFQTNDFTGQVLACGGSGQGTGAPSGWGGPGTIYMQLGASNRSLVLKNCGNNDNYFVLSGTNALLFADAEVIVSGATLSVDSQQVFGKLTVESGGWITHRAGNESGLWLQVLGDATVQAGGSIAADGAGYGAWQGPGAPPSGERGASYGGVGANGPPAYGSATEPVDFGSGASSRGAERCA